MQFDSFEQAGLKTELIDGKEKLSTLHKGFESRLTPAYENFLSVNETAQEGIALWIGENAALSQQFVPGAMDMIKAMYWGMEAGGITTLGLEQINQWAIHPEYVDQCIKQHAGYAAEVISTTKENLIALRDGTGITTVRADDLPDMFPKNDQYVDKVRLDASRNIIERIQTKFVGKDAKECLVKLKSREFDKYILEDKVDKVEIPKDYYDSVKAMVNEQIDELKTEIERVKANGNEVEVLKKQKELERLKAVDQKIEKSTVTTQEAVEAVTNPKQYMRRIYIKDTLLNANKAGLDTGGIAAGLSCAVSTVDNVQKYFKGEVTAQEAVIDIAKDTGVAGIAGYGTGFVTSAVATTMSHSSHVLIQKVGSSCAPAAVVAWGVQSFDSITDYAQGEITGNELAYELGKNGASVAGGIVGGMATGAALGSVVPGAGTVVGAGIGLVGGMVGSMVGCAVASEAYTTAVEHGGEGAKVLATKAQELATNTVEAAKVEVPEKVDFIKQAINDFATENDVPIRV